jgi:penicillin-binding protein 1C
MKFKESLIEFEDKTFYSHPGLSAQGIGRALVQNSRSMSVKSGGSTLTMQLARMARKSKSRGIWDKIVESLMATRIELSYSKEEILSLYAAHAPFGGNVVGLEAASWRYFGRSADKLSWAESATLAVLPNAPSLIFPGKNEERLRNKRNRLLKSLHKHGKINNEELELALTEPLPGRPIPIPQLATQLLDHAIEDGNQEQRIYSSIDRHLQEQVLLSLERYHNEYEQHQVHNLSTIIIDVKTNKVIAYVGNTSDFQDHGSESSVVNCANARRSTGSILKPLLYAASMEKGEISPESILPDIPTHISGFSPKNFNQTYDGAVSAKTALSRSLNIPMVRLLAQHGTQNFHEELKNLGFTTFDRPTSEYGLSLILGGAETSLFEVCAVYSSLAQQLNSSLEGKKHNGKKLSYLINDHKNNLSTLKKEFSASVIYQMVEAMVEVNRPGEESNWRYLGNGNKIAWKTGTSYGFRDAWSIGLTKDYLVGVWIGNADGEGRPGLTGISMAAPVLFDLFDKLPRSNWFAKPQYDMIPATICRHSGFRSTENCELIDTLILPKTMAQLEGCKYHQLVHLDAKGENQLSRACANEDEILTLSWFVLPPAMEEYYKLKSADYKVLPPWKAGCNPITDNENMAINYPKKNSRITVPIGVEGNKTSVVFEASHRRTKTEVHWHMDEQYLGSTREIHQMNLQPEVGKHRLLLIDEHGESVSTNFEIR